MKSYDDLSFIQNTWFAVKWHNTKSRRWHYYYSWCKNDECNLKSCRESRILKVTVKSTSAICVKEIEASLLCNQRGGRQGSSRDEWKESADCAQLPRVTQGRARCYRRGWAFKWHLQLEHKRLVGKGKTIIIKNFVTDPHVINPGREIYHQPQNKNFVNGTWMLRGANNTITNTCEQTTSRRSEGITKKIS